MLYWFINIPGYGWQQIESPHLPMLVVKVSVRLIDSAWADIHILKINQHYWGGFFRIKNQGKDKLLSTMLITLA